MVHHREHTHLSASERSALSDLISRIVYAKRELAALKAGFSGDERRFSEAVITQQSFTLNITKPLTVTVAFPNQDFPQLYTSVYDNTSGIPYGANLFDRKNLYQWRMGLSIAAHNYTITAVLLSEQTPTSFVLVQDP